MTAMAAMVVTAVQAALAGMVPTAPWVSLTATGAEPVVPAGLPAKADLVRGARPVVLMALLAQAAWVVTVATALMVAPASMAEMAELVVMVATAA